VIVGGTDGRGKWSALNESLPGRIFISYRRQETAWPAGRLYDVLVEHFPPEQVFKDVDNIDPGDDFVERITAAVSSCDVLLALIGQQWLTITDETGQRRLDNPGDYVRLEIETALTRKIRVIPILVDDAQMPRANQLPANLAPFARRNAVEINPLTFDTERLIATVRKTLELELARHQHQLATLHAEAQRLHRAGHWAAVIKVGEQLQAIDPAAADPDGLMTSARAELAAEQRATAIAADYHNGLRLFDAGRWEEAIAAFERVTKLDSTYKDVVALLGRARRELASAALAEEQARRQAGEETRRRAEEHAQRQAEEQAQRRAAEQDRAREQKEAEDRARRLRKEQRRRDTQQLLGSLRQRAARLMSRWWLVVLAVSVGIGGAVLLFSYVSRTPPAGRTIMGQLPDPSASCSATDTAATCRLTDGTVVFFRLFDTPTDANADVVGGKEQAPNGTACPPSAAPAPGDSVVCPYTVGAETGIAAFTHTVKDTHRFYEVRWIPEAHPRLRGEMTTANTNAQDWETLQSNWTRLAGMR
jgi:tetratricopeptide (TPR) repeat protein